MKPDKIFITMVASIKSKIWVWCIPVFFTWGSLIAQEPARFACYYSPNLSGDYLCNELKALGFNDDAEDAREILQRVLEPVGLRPNFVLQPCDSIRNCVATIGENGWRYILYDRIFLKDLVSKNQNNWSSISIFAHEVLHHLNQHTHMVRDASLERRRQMELEADEWSGRILAKLGSTLEEAQSAVSALNYTFDETFSSHPSKQDRLEAIERGYIAGASNPFEVKPKDFVPNYDVIMKYHQFTKAQSPSDIYNQQDSIWRISEIYRIKDEWYGFFVKQDSTKPNKIFEFDKLEDVKIKLSESQTWINTLDYLDNKWIAIQKMNEPLKGQSLRTSAMLDANEINLNKAMGTIIREISFANGQWAIIEENKENARVDDQILLQTKTFPDQQISKLWPNRYIVTSCKFVNGLWITIMNKYNKDVFATIQFRRFKSTFPLDDFIQKETEGFRLESAGFDGKTWGYVMSQKKNFTNEEIK